MHHFEMGGIRRKMLKMQQHSLFLPLSEMKIAKTKSFSVFLCVLDASSISRHPERRQKQAGVMQQIASCSGCYIFKEMLSSLLALCFKVFSLFAFFFELAIPCGSALSLLCRGLRGSGGIRHPAQSTRLKVTICLSHVYLLC